MSNRSNCALALALATAAAPCRPAFAASVTVDSGATSHIFMQNKPWMVVSRALEGAIRRLRTDECQRVLDDFSDQHGRPLTASLAATGQAPWDALRRLYFVEGDDTPQCRTQTAVAAFTEAGSHVVHVCGTRFVRFATKTEPGEILLIHEFLHTLGLGENPPSTYQITAAVMHRCG